MTDDKHEWMSPMIARLRELHGNGMPFRQIADTLNAEFNTALTRNAVIGKGRRLQLKLRATPWSTKRKEKPARPKRERRVTLRTVAPPLVPPEPVTPGTLTMEQLTEHTCRWPEGLNPPYTYCGEPTLHGTSFCRAHCIRAYGRAS